MAKELKNVAASVRARLLTISKSQGRVFDVVLTRYVLERLLYRLSQSSHADRFVLKGAMLLTTWLPHTNRGTRDLDLLGFGDSSEARILGIFRQIFAMRLEDGVDFDLDTISVQPIREELEYGGLRLRTIASVAGARVRVSVDIGFGDSTEPGLEEIDYPTILDSPAPKLRAYARETVIAEKLHAMVALGRANSRMKDFYDIWVLSRTFTFEKDRLARAIAATFARRQTPVPLDPLPDALTPAFAQDPDKQRQWGAFVADIGSAPADLPTVVSDLAAFLQPYLAAANGN